MNWFTVSDVREWHTQEEHMVASAHRQGCEQQTSSFQLDSMRRGTDYVYQSFSPISFTRRHVFQTNDHAPRNTSNTSGWFRPSQGYWYIPLWEWQCRYSWRSMSEVLCQNRYLGVSFTLINDNIKICAKWSGKTLIDSHRNALLGNAELLKFIWMFCQAPSAEHWHMASWQCHTPAFTHRLCSPPGQKRLRGTHHTESNTIKVVFGHEGTQHSPVTARNIRPNTQALVDWLHGCVPFWFHFALLQPYHTIVTGLLLVFWCPFNSASPANVTAALQDKSRIRAVCYKENSSVVEALSKDSDVLTSLWWCCHYQHPRLSTAGAIVHLISRDAIFSHAGRASLLSPIVALAHLNLPDCGFHKKNSRSAAIFLMH